MSCLNLILIWKSVLCDLNTLNFFLFTKLQTPDLNWIIFFNNSNTPVKVQIKTETDRQ